MDEYKRLKQSFKDVLTTFNIEGKTQAQLNTGTYKKELLAEALVSLSDICEKALNLYENHNAQDQVVDKIALKVQDVITKMVPTIVADALKVDKSTNAKPAQNEEKHAILLENKDENADKYNNNSWVEVVRSSISGKLKNIPVQRSLVTKSGQGCLLFPTKDDQEQAQKILENDFNISISTKKKKQLLPKIKVFKINDSYKKDDKDVLKMAVLEKNPYIKAFISDQHTFEVLIIDEKYHYCILKVSPAIREAMMKRGSLFIDMESHHIKDHVHVIQCFSCQGHGHKRGDDECPHKGTNKNVCLYCGGDHESKNCSHKKDQSHWNCINCMKSDNSQVRMNAKGHTSTSPYCPFVMQQAKSVISRTQGIDVKNFFQ